MIFVLKVGEILRILRIFVPNNPKNFLAMIDVKQCLAEQEKKMEQAAAFLEETLSHMRAGKANVHILDGIKVNSYGASLPLSNVSAITTPDQRTIAIKPWDKSMFPHIEKAIIDSEVGIMPENNGEIIRLNIPPLTEERRKQLVKDAKAEAEKAKVSVRNARRELIEGLKKAVKDGMPEDAQKDGEEKVQKLHDKYLKKIDEVFAAKEKEILTV